MKNGAETQVSYKISRDELIKLLNEDLAREYQAKPRSDYFKPN